MLVLPFLFDWIKVVDQRQDFRFRILLLQKRHYLVVHPLCAAIADDVKQSISFGDALHTAIGGKNVQPFGEKQIDLMNVFFKRRETRCVPRHIERAANAFILIQNDLRGRDIRFAVRPPSDGMLLFLFLLLQRVIRLLLVLEQKRRDAGPAHDRHNENNDQSSQRDHRYVDDAADTFPALSLRIEKYRLRHLVFRLDVRR